VRYVRVAIGPNGAVIRVDLIHSSGYPALDAAAMEHAGVWRYEPWRGAPASKSALARVTFRIQ
jgi:TonB family protein